MQSPALRLQTPLIAFVIAIAFAFAIVIAFAIRYREFNQRRLQSLSPQYYHCIRGDRNRKGECNRNHECNCSRNHKGDCICICECVVASRRCVAIRKRRCESPLQIATANGIVNRHCNGDSQRQFTMAINSDSHRLISNRHCESPSRNLQSRQYIKLPTTINKRRFVSNRRL